MIIKRAAAYLIDILLISTVMVIIGIVFSYDGYLENSNEYDKEINQTLNNLYESDITPGESLDTIIEINYKKDVDGASYNFIFILVHIVIFVLIPLNLGETIGMKLLKLKYKNINLLKLTLRMFVITGIYVTIVGVGLVKFVDYKTYTYLTMPLAVFSTIVAFVTMFMILYRKDNKGIQDLITKSYIVDRNEENNEKI